MKEKVKSWIDKGKNRQSNIELMRIIAMIMIVGCHFATHGGFSFDSGTLNVPRIWWHVLYLGGNFGTDVFVMISGYFLVSDVTLPPKWSKALLFWLQIIFYSIILFILSFPLGYGDTSIKSLLTTFLPVSFSAWWFASAYFVLFLLHPYINLALNAMNKKQYQRFLILIIIMWSIIPTLTTSDFQKNDLIELFLMYAIAGYIRKNDILESFTSAKWGGIWLLSCCLTVGSAILIILIGKDREIISSHSTYFYSQSCLLTIVRAVSFFMMFYKLKIRTSRIVNLISSTMFGVYLLHDSKLLRKFLWTDLFKNATYQDSLAIIPYSMLAVCSVFAICIIVDLCRQFIVERPIRKLIE